MENVVQEHVLDCSRLKATELRIRYRPEANTHRNMHQRAKSQGKSIHPEFHKFPDFLRHVGPRPCDKATLDRIDNNDPEYGPGKVRWADKRTQNSNKGDTLLFHYSRTKDTYTTSRLAKLQGVKPTTIRQRASRGWTDDEIIERKCRGEDAVRPSRFIARPPKAANTSIKKTVWARDILMQDWRNRALQARAEGYEFCLPTFDEFVELTAEDTFLPPLDKEKFDRHFWKQWLQYGQYVIVENLLQHQKDYIAELELKFPDRAEFLRLYR